MAKLDKMASSLAATLALQQRSRFDQTYGAMTIVMGYLPQFEQLKFQGLDKWWYNTGVGRVQVHLKLRELFFFADPFSKIMVVRQKDLIQQLDCKGERDFSNIGWVSCQVGRTRLFQAFFGRLCCFRILKIDCTKNFFTIERNEEMSEIDYGFLSDFNEQFAFMIHDQTPRRYSLAEHKWEELPSIPNFNAIGVCSLQEKVFVFSTSDWHKNRISALFNPGASISPQELQPHWQEIELRGNDLFPLRYQVAFLPLNSTDIAILGGQDVSNCHLSIVTIFNTNTCSSLHVILDKAISFSCKQNQSATVCANTIIALTSGQQRCLVKYTKGDTSLKSVQF